MEQKSYEEILQELEKQEKTMLQQGVVFLLI